LLLGCAEPWFRSQGENTFTSLAGWYLLKSPPSSDLAYWWMISFPKTDIHAPNKAGADYFKIEP